VPGPDPAGSRRTDLLRQPEDIAGAAGPASAGNRPSLPRRRSPALLGDRPFSRHQRDGGERQQRPPEARGQLLGLLAQLVDFKNVCLFDTKGGARNAESPRAEAQAFR